jgi:hypothetical protein
MELTGGGGGGGGGKFSTLLLGQQTTLEFRSDQIIQSEGRRVFFSLFCFVLYFFHGCRPLMAVWILFLLFTFYLSNCQLPT